MYYMLIQQIAILYEFEDYRIQKDEKVGKQKF